MSKSLTRPPSSVPANAQPAGKNSAPNGSHPKKRPPSTPGARFTAARFRSRHPLAAALVPVALVVIAVATMVVIKAAGSGGQSASHVNSRATAAGNVTGTSTLSPTVLAELSVPAATLDSVGSPASVTKPSPLRGGTVQRGADGKPLITYIGAEWCPYCAAERWAVAVALSRFGTFSDLSATHSSSTDVYPDTQTLSFYGSQYSSSYVDFAPVEEATNQRVGAGYGSLQSPTAAQAALMAKEDPEGSIPFIDIAGEYVIVGASYSPQVLQGLSSAQIAADLSNASSPVAQAIDGTANDITAAISRVTGGQPSSVAGSPVIAAIAHELGA